MKKFIRVFAFTLMIVGIAFIGFALKEMYEIKTLEERASQEVTELFKEFQEKVHVSKEAEEGRFIVEDFQPEYGEAFGYLKIDKIEANIPIIQGVQPEDLKKGVGHYDGTAYPLEDDQIVLSGHRDTVFRRMPEIEIGDVVTVQMPYGEFDYEIYHTKIVPADDLTIIVPHDEEVLTITTCYPFRYIGDAPDRFIVYAKPIYDRSEYVNFLE